jgi:hypothetical protein
MSSLIDGLTSKDAGTRDAALEEFLSGGDKNVAAQLAEGGKTDARSEIGHGNPVLKSSPFACEISTLPGEDLWLTLAGLRACGRLEEMSSLWIETLAWDNEEYPTPTQGSIPGFRDLSPLGGLEHLETLNIACSSIADLAGLDTCTALRALTVTSSPNLTDLSALKGHLELRYLNLCGCSALSDITPLAQTKLEDLNLGACGAVSDIEAVTAVETLEVLDIGRTAVRDISCLRGLYRLRQLNLNGCRKLVTVEPLSLLPGLQRLTMFFLDAPVPRVLAERHKSGELELWY